MSIDRVIMGVAGAVVSASVVAAVTINTGWLWLTGFVGVNLLQSSFTGFCPLAIILKKMGLKADVAFA